MVVTAKTTLPSVEELTVQEVDVGFPLLQAAAFHIGKYCEHHNNEFMLCRDETKDARQCVNEGKLVTACTIDFFRKLKKNCFDEFTTYWNCIDKTSGEGTFIHCRNTQAAYDKCVLDKLNVERPGFGYFCEVKIHDSKRPKPEGEKAVDYPDATPGLPEGNYPPPRFGGRGQWQS